MSKQKTRTSRLHFESLEPRKMLTHLVPECTLRAAITLSHLQAGHDIIGFHQHDQSHQPNIIVNSNADSNLDTNQPGNVNDWECTTGQMVEPIRPSEIVVLNDSLGSLPAIVDTAGTEIVADHNRINGNHPGVVVVPANPAVAKSSFQRGLEVRGDESDIAGFVIQQWFIGIELEGSVNSIGGNNIGTDRLGSTTIESNTFGVWVNAVNNTKIGAIDLMASGVSAPSNWISGNDFEGVRIVGGNETSFYHNRIGLDLSLIHI